jgi:AcrR family transcriptional regulator
MTMVMTKVTNRRRPRHELKRAIFEAAVDLFRRRGVAATSVEAIAAAAGVAKGTFFNFFPTKIDVLKAYSDAIDFEAAQARSALDPAEPRVSLRRYAEALDAVLMREGAFGRELVAALLEQPEMRRSDDDGVAPALADFAAFFRAAQAKGALGSTFRPEDAAVVLLDLWRGALAAWRASPGELLAALFGRRLDLLLDGLKR